MKLREIIDELEATDHTLCIVAKRPWTPECDAHLVHLTEDYRVPADILAAGFDYFLEVSVAVDEVLADIGSDLTPEQRSEAVLFYAENDAYPEWLCELRRTED
jgi:hypothetical protein